VASFLFAKDISSGFLAYKCCVHVRIFTGFSMLERMLGLDMFLYMLMGVGFCGVFQHSCA